MSDLQTAFTYDDAGYLEHETVVQVLNGQALLPPSTTLQCPWGTGTRDEGRFYRFDGLHWKSEEKPSCAEDLLGITVPQDVQTAHDTELRELIMRYAAEDGFRLAQSEDLSLSIERIPEKTEEEKAAEELEQAKIERAETVERLKVEVDGMTFDADETSQTRMTRAIAAAEVTGLTETVWVLADNSVAKVTLDQMKQALAKAMLAMADVWTIPYTRGKKA